MTIKAVGAVGTAVVGATRTAVVVEAVCAGLLVSITVEVKVKAPAAVGVPETVPDAEAKVNPLGSLPEAMDHL